MGGRTNRKRVPIDDVLCQKTSNLYEEVSKGFPEMSDMSCSLQVRGGYTDSGTSSAFYHLTLSQEEGGKYNTRYNKSDNI